MANQAVRSRRGEGVPVDITPVETDRDSLASDDILINRHALMLHPFGVKFTNASVADVTPHVLRRGLDPLNMD